jgi:hypothetical protein
LIPLNSNTLQPQEVFILDILTSGYQKSIENLQKLKTLIQSENIHESQLFYIRQIDNDIAYYQIRIDRVKPKIGATECEVCKIWSERDSIIILNNSVSICYVCVKNSFDINVASVFESKHGIPIGTIKQDAKSIKDPLKKYKEANLVKRSGTYWLVHEIVWDLHYKYKYGASKMNI